MGDGRAVVDEPIGVVLVHWDQAERCLAAAAAFVAQAPKAHVWIVDNGSRADQLDRLRTGVADVGDPSAVELVELGHNAGYGPAANVGFHAWLKDGPGDWVALAPHDASPEAGCLAALVAAGRGRPRAGLVSADVGDARLPIVDPYFGGITLPPERARDRLRSTGPSPDGWEPVGYPHGTLLLARRSCLLDIGLFDERYFAYCEEADLGERARRAGWEVGLVAGARVRNPHQGGGTPVVDYLQTRNTLLLVRDHFGRYNVTIRAVLALGQLLSGVLRPATRPLWFAPRARLLAMRDWSRNRFGPPPPDL